jgi:hypothetical protein
MVERDEASWQAVRIRHPLLVLIGMVVLLLVFVVALAMTVASHAHL